MDIKELIFSCLQDDPKAQKQFYDLTCDKVMATCKRYSKDHEEARDFFQESYIRIFKSLNTFQIEKGNILAWVYTITRNVVFDKLRNKKVNFVELTTEAENLEYNVEQFDTLLPTEIESEIQKMPDGYRTILNLFVFEEQSHAEIAKILNITESTSRSQYLRAKNYLKKNLETIYSKRYEKYIV